MNETIFQVEDVKRRYGGVAAVDGVSLEIRRSEFLAIIGSNGAGKTTLFNLFTGTARPSSGRIRFAGTDITVLPPHRRARLGIGRTFQINNVFGDETVEENVRIALIARKRRQWDVFSRAEQLYGDEIAEIVDKVGLLPELRRPANVLSYGDRRRLEIAIALAGEPKLLFLDEPTCGMSLADRLPLVELIRSIVRQDRLTAVIIEHDMDVVFSVAERVFVMHRGRVIAQGAPGDIVANDAVRQVYLGDGVPGTVAAHA